MFIAMVIRDAMEDFHHKHLSDAQMMELNPIIRDAVYTALHALQNGDRRPESMQFAGFQYMMIPKYWEPPEFLDDYVQSWQATDRRPNRQKPAPRRPPR